MFSSTVHRLPTRASRNPPAMEAVEEAFRHATRQLASGVCVLTLGTGEERAGLLATSVSPLSANPPTLLISIERASAAYPALARLGAFAVNVLAADQREVAERLSASSGDRSSATSEEESWLSAPSGISCLANSLGVFDCEIEERIERRGHAIVIARVRRALAGAGSGALVSWRGFYDQVGWSNEEIARAVGLSPCGGRQ